MVNEVEQVGIGKVRIHGVTVNDEGGGGEAPIKFVKLGDEGVGEDVIIVDEGTFGITGSLGDSPTEGFAGTGQDFGLASSVLGFDLFGDNGING